MTHHKFARRVAGKFAVVAALLAATGELAAGEPCLQVPVQCVVTSAFGGRYNPVTRNFSTEYHHGVDFGCPIGTPVQAAGAGSVLWSGSSQTAGNWVRERAPGRADVRYEYMHHERNLVSSGSLVNAGQEIARTGSTGRSTGPHLHFQVMLGGKAVDPVAQFCTRPQLAPGVLQGAEPAVGDTPPGLGQATAPGDGGGVPPALGMDSSLHEVLGDAIAARALNPDYMRQLSTLTAPRLFAELAYMKALRLKVQSERAQHRERMEATQAMIELLRVDSTLRLQLESQRRATSRRP